MLPLGVDGSEAFERSFDFSTFPNLQEVDFGVSWMGGGLPWIPKALSTLKYTTSPRLSSIRVDFTCSYIGNPSVQTAIWDTANDLRQVTDEVARIEREFGGVVESTVFRDPVFEAVSDALSNVTFQPGTPLVMLLICFL